MPKMCKYRPNKRCYHDSCDFIDNMGNVTVCPLHPDPNGYLTVRKVVVSV
jgi:hypothetical protein